jgi:hypothetical protein
MPRFEENQVRTTEDYRLAVEAFTSLVSYLLFGFARHQESCDIKNTILQNFIARTTMLVKSIVVLWDLSNYQDCWALHRCLIDRLFHLFELEKSNSYEEFEEWSFKKQFEAQNRVRSDPSNIGAAGSPLFTPTPDQKKRYSDLAKKRGKPWRRPQAEVTAKEMGLTPLYTHGYDYACMFIHPMANDGSEDFFTITKLQPRPDFPSHLTVLHNSLIVGLLIVQRSLNQSDFRWRKDIYDLLDLIMKFLDDGSADYQTAFVSFFALGPSITLCVPD